MDQNFLDAALFEHRFWLQILGDHSRFLFHSLSPAEEKYIRKAHYFIKTYEQLLAESRKPLSLTEVNSLSKKASGVTKNLKEFKLELQRRLLVGKINANLSESFVNHMINELEEYEKVLTYLIDNQVPVLANPIDYHLVWILDAIGHAESIITDLDYVEKDLIKESKEFSVKFTNYYLKAVEMSGYTRTNITKFPALARLTNQVELEMSLFNEFIIQLRELSVENKILGPMSVLIADHYFREECYYLTKIASVTNSNLPDCDPTKPRIKS